MNDERDPILDACLDEVLAGRRPPDLTARILQAWAARGHVGTAPPAVTPSLGPSAPPVIAPSSNGRHLEAALAATPPNGQPVVALRTSSAGARLPRRRSSSGWQAAMIAGCVLVVAGVAAVTYVASQKPQIAENRPGKAPQQAVAGGNQHVPVAVPKQSNAPHDGSLWPNKPVDVPQVVKTPPSSAPGSNQIVDSNPSAPPTPPVPTPEYRDPAPDAEVVSFVNAELHQTWVEAGVKPSDPATDSEWCRRLFVRVLGRIPTVEELQGFSRDKSPTKREQLVDRLLTDEKYVEEYARHWAVVWSNTLIGRTGGRGDSLADRDSLEQYLRSSLAHNKPYDKLVHELLTATGSSKPGAPDSNGAVNFLLDGANDDATLASSRVSRVFLGQQLQCAQCHSHPSQDWSQEHFWAFNSFFRQMKVEKGSEANRLVNVDFPGQGQGSTEGEVFYETPTGLLKTAFPRFIDGTEVPKSGHLADVDRRAELARMIVASEQFPKALVNRLWSHFFGYGFTNPVDDMGPNSTPSQPELLDRMADEFVARQYDLKSVIRWIALSDPFSRSSKLSSLATKDMPEAGEVALFSRYYSRQMQAEEVYNSLVQAAQIRKTAANEAEVEKARVDWLAQFSRNMATDDAMEESHFSGGMRQSLIMMNGDLMKRAVSGQKDGVLKTVMASEMKFDKKVEHLFLSALSREPTRREQQALAAILASSGGNEAVALEDIWWALLNSNEFILDH